SEFLRDEHITVVAKDLGGIHPRKICYFPLTGRAMVKLLPHAHDDAVAAEEVAYKERLRQTLIAGSVELF
ncbi:MAG TPA: chemoreceptor glutamine deamidase CheD, partial [Xanthomonadaceae bacterium]|nr:chemoreceptor glutamine deamidase CheD [Xanthomonadaceae bacterium]